MICHTVVIYSSTSVYCSKLGKVYVCSGGKSGALELQKVSPVRPLRSEREREREREKAVS